MVHACVCCQLRFGTNAELADHVRDEHSEHPEFEEGKVTVVRQRFAAAAERGRTRSTRHGS